MIGRNARFAVFTGVLLLNVVFEGSVFAQGNRSVGRLNVGKARAISTTNYTKVAATVTGEAPDLLDLPNDAAGEARRREMLRAFAAERQRRFLAASTAAPVQIPNVEALSIEEGRHSARGFAGISNLSSANVNAGFSSEPPDQGLCVGNGFVLETVNSAVAVYSETGQLIAGVADLNQFMGQKPESDPTSLNVSDPRCLYDQSTKRWFVTAIGYSFDPVSGNIASSELLIAVSTSNDPTAGFIVYGLDTTNDGSDFLTGDCPCLGDQPLLGADANGLYLSTN